MYLQLGGEPVDSTPWFQEHHYKPTLKKKNNRGSWEEFPWQSVENHEDNWRIFVGATSNAKGPVGMFLTAMISPKRGDSPQLQS